MKPDRDPNTLFTRFLHWAEGEEGESSQEAAEDPERIEFMEYLEYLDAHEHIDFGTYRLMRYRERAEKGLPAMPSSSHGAVSGDTTWTHHKRRKKHRPGQLRRQIRFYRVASVLACAVLMSTLFLVVLTMPRFGNIHAPAMNEVPQRYLEQGLQETGAVNAVTGMILDYRAFDTFGEATVLFAAAASVTLLLHRKPKHGRPEEPCEPIFRKLGGLILPAVMMFGIYVVLNGHLSPGGGFSGGTVLGCGLILATLVLGKKRMEQLLPNGAVTAITVCCLLAYAVMKGYSFFTGANHVGWPIPKGLPGAIFSGGLILPLNICVGVIVACTMYTFYTLFAQREA